MSVFFVNNVECPMRTASIWTSGKFVCLPWKGADFQDNSLSMAIKKLLECYYADKVNKCFLYDNRFALYWKFAAWFYLSRVMFMLGRFLEWKNLRFLNSAYSRILLRHFCKQIVSVPKVNRWRYSRRKHISIIGVSVCYESPSRYFSIYFS